MTRAGKFFSAFARSTPLVSSTAAIGTAFADEMSGMNVSAGAMSHAPASGDAAMTDAVVRHVVGTVTLLAC
jgi:hypothetical protein